MAPGGIEPTTFALLARRSNQLSYGALLMCIGLLFLPAIDCNIEAEIFLPPSRERDSGADS